MRRAAVTMLAIVNRGRLSFCFWFGYVEPRYLQSIFTSPSLRKSPLSKLIVAKSRIQLCSMIRQSTLSRLCTMLKYDSPNALVLYCESNPLSYLFWHQHVSLKQDVSMFGVLFGKSASFPHWATHEVVHYCVLISWLLSLVSLCSLG